MSRGIYSSFADFNPQGQSPLETLQSVYIEYCLGLPPYVYSHWPVSHIHLHHSHCLYHNRTVNRALLLAHPQASAYIEPWISILCSPGPTTEPCMHRSQPQMASGASIFCPLQPFVTSLLPCSAHLALPIRLQATFVDFSEPACGVQIP